MTLALTETRLHALCGAEGKFDACTRFVGFRLDAACSYDGRDWRMTTAARFRPYIVLKNIQALPHEHLHIGDMRDSVNALTAKLGAMAFASEPQCRARALSEEASFESELRDFARTSNITRHPQLLNER